MIGPPHESARAALRGAPEVERQAGQEEKHRVLGETAHPDQEPQGEPRADAAAAERPVGGQEREGPGDDERRVDRGEETPRPDERRHLEADHRQGAGLRAPVELPAEPVERPRADEAQADGAQADGERGRAEHRRQRRDEVGDQGPLRVVREVEPARPLPVVSLVGREIEVAPDEEPEPESRQDRQRDGDEHADPRAAPRRGPARSPADGDGIRADPRPIRHFAERPPEARSRRGRSARAGIRRGQEHPAQVPWVQDASRSPRRRGGPWRGRCAPR